MRGAPVTEFDNDLKRFAQDMVETMYAADGVGLAAQQVGRAIQMFVMDVSHLPEEENEYRLDGLKPPLELIMPMVCINPVVRLLPGKLVAGEEGCLSFPDIRGDVPRADAVEMDYQDINGRPHRLDCRGWFARVIQHEHDHLEGVLFIDRMEKRQQRNLVAKIKRLQESVEAALAEGREP